MSDVKTQKQAVDNVNRDVLAEQYVRARTERDRVVSAFNTLKARQREIEEELAELRRAAQDVVEECYDEGNVTTAVITLNGLV